MCFIDRSGSGQWYVNGAASGAAVDISSRSATMTSTQKLTFGLNSSGGNNHDEAIAYYAMWQREAWLDTHLQASLAQERSQRLTGLHPQGKGTLLANVLSRSSSKTFEKATAGVTKLYTVGDNWVPVSRIDHNADSTADTIGIDIEDTEANSIIQSEDVGTSWTEVDAGDTQSLNAIAAPDGETTADGNIADATDGQHGFTQAVTLTAALWTISVHAKAGDQTHLYLSDDTVANADIYADLSDCTAGTVGAAVRDSFVFDYGNGWCRVGITFTGTAAAHTIRIASAAADTDDTFAGDAATVNTYFWGMQGESKDHLTSYIATTTTATTRTADNLQYKMDDGNMGGVGSNLAISLAVDFWFISFDSSAAKQVFDLSDGGSNNDHISVFTSSANENLTLVIAAGGTTTVNALATSGDDVSGAKISP